MGNSGFRFTFRAWQRWDDYDEMVRFDIYQTEQIDELDSTAIMMQYTGFEDKNGLEVFESDIVKVGNKNYEVIWDDFMWNLKDFYDPGFDYPTIAFSECAFEVIGNKYENPELLEG